MHHVVRWYNVDYLPVFTCFFLEVSFVALFQRVPGPILNAGGQQAFREWGGEGSIKKNQMGMFMVNIYEVLCMKY